MKRSVLLLALVISCVMNAQNADWSWAAKGSGTHDDWPRQVAVDPWGYIYMTGAFGSNTFQLPPHTLHNQSDSTTRDIFLVKYTPAGQVIWAISAGGTLDDEGKAVTVDGAGNVYLAGQFQSDTLKIEGQALENQSNPNWADAFVAKFDSAGNMLWVDRYGWAGYESVFDMETDALGNSYFTGVAGPFSAQFGSYPFYPTVQDPYVCRIDATGNVLWVKGLHGEGLDGTRSSALNTKGQMVIGGLFNSDTLYADSDTLFNLGKYDFFVATYDATGNVVMAKSFGTADDEEISSISTDLNDNIYITGYYRAPQMVLGSYTLSNVSGYDGFFAKLDSAGNVLWAQNVEGNFNVFPKGVSADNFGNVYLTGPYSHNISFGNTTFTASTFNVNTYLVQFDAASGNVQWAKNIKDQYNETPFYVTSDHLGSVYLAGIYGPSVSIGSHTLSGTPEGHSEVFLTKLCQSPLLPTVPGVTVCPGEIAGLNLDLPPGILASWFNAGTNGTLLSAGASFSASTSQTVFLSLENNAPGCGFIPPLTPVHFSVHPAAGLSVVSNSLVPTLAAGLGISYKWYDCDYGAPVGWNDDEPLAPPQNGNYALIVSYPGCVDTTGCFNFFRSGVVDAAAHPAKVFSTGQVIVIDAPPGEYVVLDALGRTVSKARLRNVPVHTDALKPGMYYVSDQRSAVYKVLVH